MRESRHLTRALSSAAIALGRTREAEEVVRVAIAETQRVTGIEAVALHLLTDQRDELILREFAGTPTLREPMARLPLAGAPAAARAVRDRCVVSAVVAADPPRSPETIYAAHGFCHVTVVPVEGREHVLGVLHLASRGAQPLEAADLALVRVIGGLVGVALENAALREGMIAQRDRMRALAEGTLHAREEEARRIAHELHDEAGQLLASVHIALDELARTCPAEGGALRRLHELLDRVEGQLRRLSRELRPTILDDLGLAPALEWLAQGMSERTSVPIRVAAAVGRLPAPVETALYRIAQEAVTNAVRHARPTRLDVEVRERDGWVEATVQDDGRGFDVAASLARRGDRGLGLISMRERAEMLGGRLSIVSSPSGTRLSVRIPVGTTA